MALAVLATGHPALDTTAGAPMWWLRRLHSTLLDRRAGMDQVRLYYKGDFKWRYADAKLREVFGHVFYNQRVGVNWMKLIVTSLEERLEIDGIRVGDAKEADPTAWKIWQAANLEARSARVHRHSMLYGVSYVTVWPDENDEPKIKIDHPAQAVVEVDPEDDQNRLAGLRTYLDVEGYMHAQLFLPEEMYAYVSRSPLTSSRAARESATMSWVVDTASVPEGIMANPMKAVPMVPFLNEPAAEWPGEEDGLWLIERSELHGAMPIQDAINSVLLNVLLAANDQGYKQRWVTGLTVVRDKDGKPISPFEAGITRLWQAEKDTTKFGEFTTTDVTPLLNVIDQLVRNLASISQLPPHMLEPRADRLSADSIRASESGLIAKIRHKHTIFGMGWKEVLRLIGILVHNQELVDNTGQIMWGNPETNTLAALFDAALKSVNIGLPWRARMEMLGYGPDEIERMQAQREQDAALEQPAIDSLAQVKVVNPGAPTPPDPNTLPAPAGQGASQ